MCLSGICFLQRLEREREKNKKTNESRERNNGMLTRGAERKVGRQGAILATVNEFGPFAMPPATFMMLIAHQLPFTIQDLAFAALMSNEIYDL